MIFKGWVEVEEFSFVDRTDGGAGGAGAGGKVEGSFCVMARDVVRFSCLSSFSSLLPLFSLLVCLAITNDLSSCLLAPG